MILQKLKAFHQKTMDAYQEEEKSRLEPWKKKVLHLHEASSFLFYFDEYLIENEKERILLVKGDYVKGKPKEKDKIYLYDGQGAYLGLALLLSNPEEKEEQRRGFLTPHRYEFSLKLLTYRGKKVKELSAGDWSQMQVDLLRRLSLISDLRNEGE